MLSSNKHSDQNIKTFKIIAITAIICFLISGVVGVVAVNLTAKDISFKSNNDNWEVSNVEDAMDDLYEISSTTKAKLHTLGSGRSFNISNIVGADNISKYSEDNFIVTWKFTAVDKSFNPAALTFCGNVKTALASDFVKSYNKETGVLTITGGKYNIYLRYTTDYTNFTTVTSESANATPLVYFVDNLEV